MSQFDFRQVTGSSKFRAWKGWRKGEYVILVIESFSPNKKNKNYQDITGKLLEHNFNQSDWQKGDRVSINGTTGIQKFLDAACEGQPLNSLVGQTAKIVYCGSETVKTGQWAGSQTHVIEGYLAGAKTNDVAAEAADLVEKAKSVL